MRSNYRSYPTNYKPPEMGPVNYATFAAVKAERDAAKRKLEESFKDAEILKLRAYAVALEYAVGSVKIYEIRTRLGMDPEAIQTDPRVQELIDAALSEPKT